MTSRALLQVAGEQRLPVLPLAVPAAAADTGDRAAAPLAAIAAAPAVQLFVARAQAVASSFALTAENAGTVAAICRRLEGLPLAIELAAAWMRVLTPHELLARLEPRLPLLRGGGVDQPARLRTMWAAIAWSVDRLSAEEARLFRRLAVFRGGFTLEAVEAVAGLSLRRRHPAPRRSSTW